MTHWIWETTPVHVDFNSDAFRGEIVEPISGEAWEFDLARYASVAVPSENKLRAVPIHPSKCRAEELENGIRIVLEREGVRCVLEILIDSEAPELTASVRPVSVSSRQIMGAVFPGPIFPKARRRHEVLDTVGHGRLHRPIGSGEHQAEMSGSTTSMGWWAQLGEKSSVLGIVETPFDWEWSTSDSPKETKVLHQWTASLGALNYQRKLRYVFFRGRGYVQAARRYRRHAKKIGFHVPLEERLAEIPALERLRGACSIFLGSIDQPECDYGKNLQTLKETGIERAFVYPVAVCSHNADLALGELSLIERPYLGRDVEDNLEFVAAPEMWVETIREKTSAFQKTLLTHRPDPRTECHSIGDERVFHIHAGYAKEMLPDLEEDYEDYLGCHFETLSPRPLGEHRQALWPYSRAEDARLRRALMQRMADRKMVVAANSLKEWALPAQHLGAGLSIPRIGTGEPMWPVPLWHLVYHDACFCTWRDNEGYTSLETSNGSSRQHCLVDMLYGNMPQIQPMGTHFQVTAGGIEPVHRSMSDQKVKDALPHAIEAAKQHRRCAFEDLIYHAVLAEDGSVQETAFASGLHAIVNLGKEPYRLPGGHVIEQEGILID